MNVEVILDKSLTRSCNRDLEYQKTPNFMHLFIKNKHMNI